MVVVGKWSWSRTNGRRFCKVMRVQVNLSLKTGHVETLMHDESIEAQNPHVGSVWKFGDEMSPLRYWTHQLLTKIPISYSLHFASKCDVKNI
ncbi:hypothetical protein TNCV_4061171 [Trichonephila clavipes]|nr:hypothetical protein TNCV_4061171 [Trichonephila clavipes]